MKTMRDANLEVTRALPNGAATVTSATAIQVKSEAALELQADVELELSAPALTTALNADAATVKYSIVHGNAADLSDAAVLAGDVLVQTGAGGAGSAAATARYKLPSTCKKYVGMRIVKSGSGDATALSATLSMRF
jgi:hypothetical protein